MADVAIQVTLGFLAHFRMLDGAYLQHVACTTHRPPPLKGGRHHTKSSPFKAQVSLGTMPRAGSDRQPRHIARDGRRPRSAPTPTPSRDAVPQPKCSKTAVTGGCVSGGVSSAFRRVGLIHRLCLGACRT